MAAALGSTALPANSWAAGNEAQDAPGYYPPALTGMRGSHEGSYEAAHRLRDNRGIDPASAEDTHETYDLVVVGGGISGLSAGYFFLKEAGRSAKVLILDNHDDFGGHAKRNEFRYKEKLLVLNGGTLNIESPLRYNAPAKQLLQDVGIDLDRYQSANRKIVSSIRHWEWAAAISSTKKPSAVTNYYAWADAVASRPKCWPIRSFPRPPKLTY